MAKGVVKIVSERLGGCSRRFWPTPRFLPAFFVQKKQESQGWTERWSILMPWLDHPADFFCVFRYSSTRNVSVVTAGNISCD